MQRKPCHLTGSDVCYYSRVVHILSLITFQRASELFWGFQIVINPTDLKFLTAVKETL